MEMTNGLSFEALELAIAALEQGLREHEQYPQLFTVRDGVIQRFEIALDLSQKLMKRVLRDIYNLEPARIAKNTAREAAEMGLIADTEAWIGHIDARNDTAHTYDTETAERVFNRVPLFLADARDLLMRLKNAAG
jgi:nucleotidyltransferase substrate binding protein (TIGR01987 family)